MHHGNPCTATTAAAPPPFSGTPYTSPRARADWYRTSRFIPGSSALRYYYYGTVSRAPAYTSWLTSRDTEHPSSPAAASATRQDGAGSHGTVTHTVHPRRAALHTPAPAPLPPRSRPAPAPLPPRSRPAPAPLPPRSRPAPQPSVLPDCPGGRQRAQGARQRGCAAWSGHSQRGRPGGGASQVRGAGAWRRRRRCDGEWWCHRKEGECRTAFSCTQRLGGGLGAGGCVEGAVAREVALWATGLG